MLMCPLPCSLACLLTHLLPAHPLLLPCPCDVAWSLPQGSTLTAAWVGDSRMVLGRQRKKGWRNTWEAIDLSVDHKPTTPEERQRILDSHGRVERCACTSAAMCQPIAARGMLSAAGCWVLMQPVSGSFWTYALTSQTSGCWKVQGPPHKQLSHH